MPRLQCISGSNSPNVGQWIAPSGQDITYSTSDSFDVELGGMNDPGYVDITLHSGQFITFSDQGMYTCLIPDETGVTCSLLVGIYLPALISKMQYQHTMFLVIIIFTLYSFCQDKFTGRECRCNVYFELYFCWITCNQCDMDKGW